MATPFRLRSGDVAPRQQSPTTCGSAALTVARMLADPRFTRWITLGVGPDSGQDADPAADQSSTAARFAAYEQVVVGRTNALFGAAGRPQLPWPRALGTPPWGARHELELGLGPRGARFAVHPVRFGSRAGLERDFTLLCSRVRPGHPALLYVGNAGLPRHVVLVLPPTGRSALDVYEPSSGRVVGLDPEPFVTRSLALAGWDLPWAVVWSDYADDAESAS